LAVRIVIFFSPGLVARQAGENEIKKAFRVEEGLWVHHLHTTSITLIRTKPTLPGNYKNIESLCSLGKLWGNDRHTAHNEGIYIEKIRICQWIDPMNFG
jgi:hypothetical protein